MPRSVRVSRARHIPDGNASERDIADRWVPTRVAALKFLTFMTSAKSP